jgi:hypothetical protein
MLLQKCNSRVNHGSFDYVTEMFIDLRLLMEEYDLDLEGLPAASDHRLASYGHAEEPNSREETHRRTLPA